MPLYQRKELYRKGDVVLYLTRYRKNAVSFKIGKVAEISPDNPDYYVSMTWYCKITTSKHIWARRSQFFYFEGRPYKVHEDPDRTLILGVLPKHLDLENVRKTRDYLEKCIKKFEQSIEYSRSII